jgi:hypothetical protein
MTHRMNRRELWELSPAESAQIDRRYGEYLAQLEAQRERRTETVKAMSGLRETEKSDGQTRCEVSQA